MMEVVKPIMAVENKLQKSALAALIMISTYLTHAYIRGHDDAMKAFDTLSAEHKRAAEQRDAHSDMLAKEIQKNRELLLQLRTKIK